MKGIAVVNKPTGMTSHDVVAIVRRKFNMRRVGHAGTLDPLATGVLVMLLGESTRLFRKFEAFDKAYRATLILGVKTTTADIQGKVVKELFKGIGLSGENIFTFNKGNLSDGAYFLQIESINNQIIKNEKFIVGH